jgi:hypothetical protein
MEGDLGLRAGGGEGEGSALSVGEPLVPPRAPSSAPGTDRPHMASRPAKPASGRNTLLTGRRLRSDAFARRGSLSEGALDEVSRDAALGVA